MSRSRLAALTLAAGALMASGCGSGSAKSEQTGFSTKQTGTSSKSLTQAELVARANAICRRVHAERAALPSINSKQDLRTVLSRAGAQEQAGVVELEKLVPPSAVANDWKQIVKAGRTLAGYTTLYGQYVASGNSRAARTLFGAVLSLQKSMAAVAKRDGFVSCTEFTS